MILWPVTPNSSGFTWHAPSMLLIITQKEEELPVKSNSTVQETPCSDYFLLWHRIWLIVLNFLLPRESHCKTNNSLIKTLFPPLNQNHSASLESPHDNVSPRQNNVRVAYDKSQKVKLIFHKWGSRSLTGNQDSARTSFQNMPERATRIQIKLCNSWWPFGGPPKAPAELYEMNTDPFPTCYVISQWMYVDLQEELIR